MARFVHALRRKCGLLVCVLVFIQSGTAMASQK